MAVSLSIFHGGAKLGCMHLLPAGTGGAGPGKRRGEGMGGREIEPFWLRHFFTGTWKKRHALL